MTSLLSSAIPHEFRTTCVRPLVDDAAIENIADLIQGAQKHALQRVQHEACEVLHPEFFLTHDWFLDDTTLERFQTKIAAHVTSCIIR